MAADSGVAGSNAATITYSSGCPICGTRKANVIAYREPELQAA